MAPVTYFGSSAERTKSLEYGETERLVYVFPLYTFMVTLVFILLISGSIAFMTIKKPII
ncbi:MAG: hypothetical protein BWY84_00929 [Candidatus Aerophobetes bacterium ADurb.Bin490]|nr:MAG: hypothetical protein BWY84_00929 [Candidatus Aerophobetes bacterium ADurb.Bin490]